MKIGTIELSPPFALAPMAGMTDTAFRRLVKRRGGCGLVVTEMVSSEGLVRGIDRTLEYAEFTEEERPVSIQIFGGDPDKMAAAAQIVEGMGADIVDVNMGCPVPKIAKHNAGCSLMREPDHAADVVRAMARAVRIPGDGENARRMGRGLRSTRRSWRDAWRMPALPRSRSTDARRRSRIQASLTGTSSRASPAQVGIPVFGSGDCIEAIAHRRPHERRPGCRRPRRPWRAEKSRGSSRRPEMLPRDVSPATISTKIARKFLLEYIDLLSRRARERSARFPACRPADRVSGCPGAGPRSRAMGHQQAASAERLVHQGHRQRLSPAGRRSIPPSRSRRCARR